MKKWEDISQFTAIVLGVILLNLIAATYFFRWDLTEEKRYSIAPSTQQLLRNLDDVITIQVYLEGDLNADFKRLRNAVQETLDEFRIYGGDFIQYQFINPNEATSSQDRNRFYQQLVEKGILPTNLYDNVDGKKIQKVIFPAALVTYKHKELPITLLKGNMAVSAKEKLNQSIEGVEYELAMAIKSLIQTDKPAIAFIEGHQELTTEEVADLTASLSATYNIERVNLTEKNIDHYDAIIVAQPKKTYTDIEKYKLDQFVMRGGKALFFVDAIQMNVDSIPLGGTYAFSYDLGIDDLLFRYGVRINQDLLQDFIMGNIVVNVGQFGDQANLQSIPFPYYIALNRFGKHPTVRNLNAVYSRFVSSIDTVKADGITKIPLVFTSKYSRIRRMPNMITLDELKADMNKELYQQKYLPILYLLEGSFTSLYKNRFSPDGSQPKIQGQNTKIIVCSDGDLIRNEIDYKTKQVLPLGFDKLSQQTFANKELVLNLLAYLLDTNGLIATRNKEVKLRPLDGLRIKEEKNMWQLVNIILPVGIIIALGLGKYYWRKKKFG